MRSKRLGKFGPEAEATFRELWGANPEVEIITAACAVLNEHIDEAVAILRERAARHLARRRKHQQRCKKGQMRNRKART